MNAVEKDLRARVAEAICCGAHGRCILKDCDPPAGEQTACIALKDYTKKTVDAVMAAVIAAPQARAPSEDRARGITEDAATLAILRETGCGCVVNKEQVPCDHPDARDSIGRKIDDCSCRNAARAVLALLPQAEAWRPIESARKFNVPLETCPTCQQEVGPGCVNIGCPYPFEAPSPPLPAQGEKT